MERKLSSGKFLKYEETPPKKEIIDAFIDKEDFLNTHWLKIF